MLHFLATIPGPIYALAGVIIGALLPSIVTAKLASKQRSLELYKIIYPQMFGLASDVMKEAELLRRRLLEYQAFLADQEHADYHATKLDGGVDAQEQKEAPRTLREQEEALASALLRGEWLLGEDVTKAGHTFRLSSARWKTGLDNDFEYASLSQLEAEAKSNYEELSRAVSSRLDTDTLISTFSDPQRAKKQRKKPSR